MEIKLISFIQTYIYRQMHLNISKKHIEVYSASENSYCRFT